MPSLAIITSYYETKSHNSPICQFLQTPRYLDREPADEVGADRLEVVLEQLGLLLLDDLLLLLDGAEQPDGVHLATPDRQQVEREEHRNVRRPV